MKIIVSGATGLVGTEVIRQCLSHPKITSVVALSRRPVVVPENAGKDADVSKLQSVILKDFTKYPDDVKAQLADADGCIWALALTPRKARAQKWDEVVRVCKDYLTAGLDAIVEARGERKQVFRFMYMSGDGCPREENAKTWILGLGDYMRLRGSVERQVLAFAAEHNDSGFEACVAKPGLISRPGEWSNTAITVWGWVGGSRVGVSECAAAMIEQVLNGFEKEPLHNVDLVRLGQEALGGGRA